MIGKSHYRVRAVKCGKPNCDRTHTWYKYRVWREGSKVKEQYMGKCDAWGNLDFDYGEYTSHHAGQQRYQRPPPTPPTQRQPSPYEILGVSSFATDAQIKKAYHSLVKQHHPDTNQHADHATIARINAAYQTLMRK